MRCCDLPLSIIIVGVGNHSFDAMIELDGDGGLQDPEGNVSHRDLVQFVPFAKFQNNSTLLAREVLAELPQQFLQYMRSKNIFPDPESDGIGHFWSEDNDPSLYQVGSRSSRRNQVTIKQVQSEYIKQRAPNEPDLESQVIQVMSSKGQFFYPNSQNSAYQPISSQNHHVLNPMDSTVKPIPLRLKLDAAESEYQFPGFKGTQYLDSKHLMKGTLDDEYLNSLSGDELEFSQAIIQRPNVGNKLIMKRVQKYMTTPF